MGGDIPRYVGLSCIRKVAEQAMDSKLGSSVFSMVSASALT